MDPIITIAIIVAIAAALFFAGGYLKAPPDTAYIISGLGKKRRILIGKAGWPSLLPIIRSIAAIAANAAIIIDNMFIN